MYASYSLRSAYLAFYLWQTCVIHAYQNVISINLTPMGKIPIHTYANPFKLKGQQT